MGYMLVARYAGVFDRIALNFCSGLRNGLLLAFWPMSGLVEFIEAGESVQ
jgi:hypothetical protein